MTQYQLPETRCPQCGGPSGPYRNPVPTVDVVVHDPQRGIVLVERKNEPFGWALPGGFIDYGESAEQAAVRELLEETGLTVTLERLLGVYSDPSRDPRKHTISCVYVGTASNPDQICGGDDALQARFFSLDDLPEGLCFDHAKIIADYLAGIV